jgi:hypothetical protein
VEVRNPSLPIKLKCAPTPIEAPISFHQESLRNPSIDLMNSGATPFPADGGQANASTLIVQSTPSGGTSLGMQSDMLFMLMNESEKLGALAQDQLDLNSYSSQAKGFDFSVENNFLQSDNCALSPGQSSPIKEFSNADFRFTTNEQLTPLVSSNSNTRTSEDNSSNFAIDTIVTFANSNIQSGKTSDHSDYTTPQWVNSPPLYSSSSLQEWNEPRPWMQSNPNFLSPLEQQRRFSHPTAVDLRGQMISSNAQRMHQGQQLHQLQLQQQQQLQQQIQRQQLQQLQFYQQQSPCYPSNWQEFR